MYTQSQKIGIRTFRIQAKDEILILIIMSVACTLEFHKHLSSESTPIRGVYYYTIFQWAKARKKLPHNLGKSQWTILSCYTAKYVGPKLKCVYFLCNLFIQIYFEIR